jgi:uncharacterized lipoprotein YajG
VTFFRKAAFRLFLAPTTVLFAGCAPATVQTPINPPQQTNAQRVPGFASPRFLVPVSDSRNDANTGAPTTRTRGLQIVTNHDAPGSLLVAVRAELQDRGFRIGPAAPEIFLNIGRIDLERQIDNSSARAVFVMTVRIEKSDGTVIYTREVEGDHDESHIEDYSVQTEDRLVKLALEDSVKRLFDDPEFNNALSEAHKS